jgi:hypothetical protein
LFPPCDCAGLRRPDDGKNRDPAAQIDASGAGIRRLSFDDIAASINPSLSSTAFDKNKT